MDERPSDDMAETEGYSSDAYLTNPLRSAPELAADAGDTDLDTEDFFLTAAVTDVCRDPRHLRQPSTVNLLHRAARDPVLKLVVNRKLKNITPQDFWHAVEARYHILHTTQEPLRPVHMVVAEAAPITWLVERFLPTEGVSLIGADAGVGKSCLLRWLAYCVSTGRPFLGRGVRQGSVLYYAFDEPKYLIGTRWQQILTTFGDLREEALYIRQGGVNPLAFAEELTVDVMQRTPALVIVDTLGDVLPLEDLNAYGPVARALGDLRQVVFGRSTHLLLAHHTNKAGGLLGSQAIKGKLDELFELQGAPGSQMPRTLRYWKSRAGHGAMDLHFTLDEATGALLLAGTHTAAESTTATKDEMIVEHVVATVQALLGDGEIASKRRITTAYRTTYGRINDKVVSAAVDRAVVQGRLQPVSQTAKDGFTIPPG